MAAEMPCRDCPLIETCDERIAMESDAVEKRIIGSAKGLIRAVAQTDLCNGPRVIYHDRSTTESICNHPELAKMVLIMESFVD